MIDVDDTVVVKGWLEAKENCGAIKEEWLSINVVVNDGIKQGGGCIIIAESSNVDNDDDGDDGWEP